MDVSIIFREIGEFSKESHGRTNYNEDQFFIAGEGGNEFAPLKYLCKKIDGLKDFNDLKKKGFIFNSYEMHDFSNFEEWFEFQFARKLVRKDAKKISIGQFPNSKLILDAVEEIDKNYTVLRKQKILLNGKNLPVQLGEWYAKCIFGLEQIKSASQRGFDFFLDKERIEIKVHWSDQASPKGIKMRKSMAELSKYCIIIYLSSNFMIRELCFLESDFILRKLSGKGHTIFLKDIDLISYFFSKSAKHFDKVFNSTSLLKFASPSLAMKIAEKF